MFTNTVSTAGLKKGLYHAVVRADNIEPVSGKPMSSLYYDVDLEVPADVRSVSKSISGDGSFSPAFDEN